MNKLIKYISKNIYPILATLLVSIFFSFLVFPALMNIEKVKYFLYDTFITDNDFKAITAIAIFSLSYVFLRLGKYYLKYLITLIKLESQPFANSNYLLIFFVSSYIFIKTYQKRYPLEFSEDYIEFLKSNWILIVYLLVIAAVCWFMFLLLSWFLSSVFKKEKAGDDTNESDDIPIMFHDEPIHIMDEDKLGRKKFIDNMCKTINELPKSKSFVLGLHGSWGEGKSSVLNILENKLRKNGDYFIMDFDPWYYKGKNAITAAFFKEIELTISKKFIFPDLKRAFVKYNRLITTGLSNAGIKFDYSFEEESLKGTINRIKNQLILTKKKFIIFIDDIDRLYPGEIMLIFKLVHLSKKINNIIFILSFDLDIVRENLKETIKCDPDFIDKIIQLPENLPAIEQKYIDEYLDKGIQKLLKYINISKHDLEDFNEEYSKTFPRIAKKFKTLRYMKRYLNGLLARLPVVKDIVSLHDFFILDIIRVFYPIVYNDIWTHPVAYVHNIDQSLSNKILNALGSNYKADEEEPAIKYTKKHLDKFIKKNGETDEVLIELLMAIFLDVKRSYTPYAASPDRDKARLNKSISSPKHFERYFMLQELSTDISEDDLTNIITYWLSKAKGNKVKDIANSFIVIKDEGKLSIFIEKLKDLSKTEILDDIVPEIIEGLSNKIKEFNKRTTYGLFGGSDYSLARNLLMNLIVNKIKKEEIQSRIEKMIMNTPDFHLAVSTVVNQCVRNNLFLKDGRTDLCDVIDVKILKEKLSDRLNDYFIEGRKNIFKELPDEFDFVFVLWQWAIYLKLDSVDNNKRVNDYIVKQVKKDHKYFIMFIKGCLGIDKDESIRSKPDDLAEVFNIPEFKIIAKEFISSSSISPEDRKSIELFLEIFSDQ